MVQDHLLPRPDQTASVAKLRFSFRRIASRDPHTVAGYKRKTPPAEPEALGKNSETNEKYTFVTAWRQAAETRLGLAPPAFPVGSLPPLPGKPAPTARPLA